MYFFIITTIKTFILLKDIPTYILLCSFRHLQFHDTKFLRRIKCVRAILFAGFVSKLWMPRQWLRSIVM